MCTFIVRAVLAGRLLFQYRTRTTWSGILRALAFVFYMCTNYNFAVLQSTQRAAVVVLKGTAFEEW